MDSQRNEIDQILVLLMKYNKQMYYSQQPSHFHPQSSQSLRQTMPILQPQQQFQQVLFSNRKLEHINCILQESEQSGGLYIGDTISTLKPQYIIDNNIKAVLCLNAQAAKNLHHTHHHIDFKYVEIQDHIQYPIYLHFESTNQFIDEKLRKKMNVLVQCHGGVSRSSTIICAYLIKHKEWLPEQAIKFLKQKRHRAKPNAGFMRQLDEYWYSLNKQKYKKEQIKNKSELRSSNASIELSPIKNEKRQRENSVNKNQLNSTAVKSIRSQNSIQSPQISKESKQVVAQSERVISRNKDVKQQHSSKLIKSQSKIIAQNPYQFFGQRSYEQKQSIPHSGNIYPPQQHPQLQYAQYHPNPYQQQYANLPPPQQFYQYQPHMQPYMQPHIKNQIVNRQNINEFGQRNMEGQYQQYPRVVGHQNNVQNPERYGYPQNLRFSR